MADDQVTIEPEFRSLPPLAGDRRWLPPAALAVAMAILGWLLGSLTSDDREVQEIPPAPEALSGDTTSTTRATTLPTRPPAATTAPTVQALAGLAMPLGAAVPGFEDVITLSMSKGDWGEACGFDVVRWWPSRAIPDVIATIHEPCGPLGGGPNFDAAGIWYTNVDDSGVLTVLPPTGVADDPGGLEPDGEAVALRVADVAWHDTESGRLAWVGCPRTRGDPGTLYTLEYADRSAEPVPVAAVPDVCGELVHVWFVRWGDWGFAFGRMDTEARESVVLLDPGGSELARFGFGPEGAYLVGAGPDCTVWTDEPSEGSPSSFLLSLDGQRRLPVPGLAEGEWVGDALWSPDGSQIALMTLSGRGYDPLIRVVDAATGETVAEIDEPGTTLWQERWSSDGDFLVYRLYDDGEGSRLVVYDTVAAAVAAELPVPEHFDVFAIRMADPTTATTFTPVEWGIALDEAGPGVHSVFMIAEAGLVAHDQVDDMSGRLIWDDTVVDLCGISVRSEGTVGFLHRGDIFQTTEGCGDNPSAMQEAFDQFGVPDTACLVVTVDGDDREYCAPLE